MRQQDLTRQILGILDTGDIYELRVTGETGGDDALGIPTEKTTKRHLLIGAQISKHVRDEWITMGIAKAGDLTLVTADELTMTNQIEHDGISYTIVAQGDCVTYPGTFYSYLIRRI